MKKAMIFALAAFVATLAAVDANAQKKGSFWVGGQFGYESTKYSGATANEISITPEFGYNLSDRWGLGIELGFQNSAIETTATSSGNAKQNANTFSIAPFARYTLLHWRKVQLYADGGFIYSHSDGSFDLDGDYTDNCSQYGGIFVNPGFAIHLTRRFALAGSVNLLRVGTGSSGGGNTDASDDVTVWQASLNSPFASGALQLGFHVTF